MEVTMSQQDEQSLLASEKRDLKKNWTNGFLNELNLVLEKCFLIHKQKKEHFITKEKLEVEIIKLLQSQKKFSPLKDVAENIKNLAVFDKKDNVIARLKSINIIDETVEIENMFLKTSTKSFDEVRFFDKFSIESLVIFDQQKLFYDQFTYKDTYRFLMNEVEKKPAKTSNYLIATKYV